MVDRLTKYTHFIPCMESIATEGLAHLVLDRLVRYNGIFKSFVINRDELSTSNYEITLVALMVIRHEHSTPPWTDGQTEEAHLRHYIN
jgi:hypothetical protein